MYVKRLNKCILSIYFFLLICVAIGCKVEEEPDKIEPTTHFEKTMESETVRNEVTCEDFINAWRAGNILEVIQGEWFLHPSYIADIHSNGSMTISVPWRPEFQVSLQGKIFQQGVYVYLDSVVSTYQKEHLTFKADVIKCMEQPVKIHSTDLTISFYEKSDSSSSGYWAITNIYDHVQKKSCYEIDSKSQIVKRCSGW